MKRRQKGQRREAAWRMRRLVVVSFLHIVLEVALFHDMSGAFIRSTISCDPPVPHHGHCPKGSFLSNETGTCEAEPASSKAWSLSARCANKDDVLNRSKKIVGHLGLCKHLGMIVAVIFLGPLVDTWGRKQIMMLGVFAGCVRMALFLSASLSARHAQTLIIVGEVVFATLNAYSVGMKAMATDLSAKEMEARSAAFCALHIMFEIAELCGFCGGYFILRAHFSSYTPVFSATACVDVGILVLAGVVLRSNTRSVDASANEADESDSEDDDDRGCCAKACVDMVAIIRVILQDRQLQSLCVLIAFHAVAITGTSMTTLLLLTSLGYSQEDASMLGIVMPILAACGAAVAPKIVIRTNAHVTLGVSMCLSIVSLTCIGASGAFRDSFLTASLLVWFGAALAGMSRGIFGGTFPAMVSVRVKAGLQGRLFAFIHVCEYVIWGICTDVAHEYLFDAKWRGLRAGTVFFTAAGILVLGLLYLVHIVPRHSYEKGLDDEEEQE